MNIDIENLKLIINTLNELGANTKEGFIWWLILTKGAIYFFGIIWTYIALFTIKLVHKLILASFDSTKLMTAAGITGYFSDTELAKACKTLSIHYKDTHI